jgi:hypothetical protein
MQRDPLRFYDSCDFPELDCGVRIADPKRTHMMSTDLPTATCSNLRCQFKIDLTDDRVMLTPTPEGGLAVCPQCNGTALFSRMVMIQARAGRRNLRG